MKALEDKIKNEGIILPGDILKVGSFLNQKVDTELLKLMAEETKRLFDGEKITKVLTIEASGLPFAAAVGMELRVPMVFAKKEKTANVSGDLVTAKVDSYTHNNTSIIYITKSYIDKNDKVLIVDDFLAKGNALLGLISLVKQCGATVVGAAIEIEKVYQGGGKIVRDMGYRVESLASITYMDDKQIKFK